MILNFSSGGKQDSGGQLETAAHLMFECGRSYALRLVNNFPLNSTFFKEHRSWQPEHLDQTKVFDLIKLMI